MSILKDVTIGACSVVGFGAVVTKSIPRFSIAAGVPAKVISLDSSKVWSRSMATESIERANHYVNKFLCEKS